MVQEKNNTSIPFPQANSFSKIVKMIDMSQDEIKNKKYIQEIIGVGSERQVLYYLSACEFLGYIDENCNFTELAKEIKTSCYEMKILLLSKSIITKPVFGEVFFKKYLYNQISTNEDIAQLISDLYGINNLSMCTRRASTVSSWINWIEKNREE